MRNFAMSQRDSPEGRLDSWVKSQRRKLKQDRSVCRLPKGKQKGEFIDILLGRKVLELLHKQPEVRDIVGHDLILPLLKPIGVFQIPEYIPLESDTTHAGSSNADDWQTDCGSLADDATYVASSNVCDWQTD